MEMTPESTPYKVLAVALRTQLLTSPELVTLLSEPSVPEVKIYLGAAPGNANLPYVRFHHVYGGEPAKVPRREFDQLWLVCAVAFDQSVAMDIDAYTQSLLLGQRIPMIEGWRAWADITKNGEYANITNMQGQQIWEIGAFYRIRGVKEI